MGNCSQLSLDAIKTKQKHIHMCLSLSGPISRFVPIPRSKIFFVYVCNYLKYFGGGWVESDFVLVFRLIFDCICCSRGRILITALAF